MKGLLLKDFCLLKKQMKLMVVFVIFYAIWAVAAKIPSMMGTMVILLSIMMPITSMSYDEAGQWYQVNMFWGFWLHWEVLWSPQSAISSFYP